MTKCGPMYRQEQAHCPVRLMRSKRGKIENGKFTIVLDSILPPMSGSQRVQPYSIEFTFSTDKTINAKANQCIYDTLKGDYEGKLCYIVD